jgi:hypothetical protein
VSSTVLPPYSASCGFFFLIQKEISNRNHYHALLYFQAGLRTRITSMRIRIRLFTLGGSDLAPHQSEAILQTTGTDLHSLQGFIFGLHCERRRPSMTPFSASKAPKFYFADPDSVKTEAENPDNICLVWPPPPPSLPGR